MQEACGDRRSVFRTLCESAGSWADVHVCDSDLRASNSGARHRSRLCTRSEGNELSVAVLGFPRIRAAGSHGHDGDVRHVGDTGQRFTTETICLNMVEVVESLQLRRCEALTYDAEVFFADAVAIVGDLQKLQTWR